MPSTLFYWCLAHPEAAITFAVTVGLVVWKRLPVATRAAIEARYPRPVNAIRVLYALFPDLVKAVAAARAVATGQPKAQPPALDPAAGEVLR